MLLSKIKTVYYNIGVRVRFGICYGKELSFEIWWISIIHSYFIKFIYIWYELGFEGVKFNSFNFIMEKILYKMEEW